ncbi:MAG: rhodanese-like domain-containing protein [Pseudomonadales bacterium]|nr:rhodanese-like domain-containing protein [Pseudomonadales bacterium]
MVYYCNGPKCGRSATAVKIALKCGYEKIFWFRGGFEEWKIKRFPIINDS